MEKHNNTDKFLAEVFKNAGLHKPGKQFSRYVMEQVSAAQIKKSRQPDWELILTVASIIVSIGTVIAIFPEFFGLIFNRSGLESVLNYIWKLFSGILNLKLTGTGTHIILVTVFTTVGLLLLDRIVSSLRNERVFLF